MAEPVGQRLGLLPALLVPLHFLSHRTKCVPPPKWSSRALVHQTSTPVPNLRESGWGLGQKTQLPLSLFRSEKLKRQFLPLTPPLSSPTANLFPSDDDTAQDTLLPARPQRVNSPKLWGWVNNKQDVLQKLNLNHRDSGQPIPSARSLSGGYYRWLIIPLGLAAVLVNLGQVEAGAGE